MTDVVAKVPTKSSDLTAKESTAKTRAETRTEGETAPTTPPPTGPYGGGELISIGVSTKAELVSSGPLMVKVDGGGDIKANTGDYIIYYPDPKRKGQMLAAVVAASFYEYIKGSVPPPVEPVTASVADLTDEQKVAAVKAHAAASNALFEHYRNTPASRVPPFLDAPSEPV